MRGEIFSFLADRPVLATICVLFFVADIVLLDHIITDRIHLKEIGRYQYEIKELQIANQKMDDKYSKLNNMYKETEARNHETQGKFDSQISSLTANLNSCQDTNLKFITKIREQDSEKASGQRSARS